MSEYVNAQEVIDYFVTEIYRMRNEKWQMLSTDEVLEMVHDAVESASGFGRN